MKKLIPGVLALLALVITAGPAGAGGWAVTSLDPVPAPEAGQTIEVGFTIRAHGVTPINVEEGVAIVIRSADGQQETFTAEPDGPVGHHVASVTFPEEGEWTWAVRQGWFEEQDLGTIQVAAAGSASPASSDSPAVAADYRWPAPARYGLPLLAVALAGWAAADLLTGRRRPVAVA